MDADVIVLGAGPVGLTLGSELALMGVRVVVLERSAVRSEQSKAMTIQPRTAEMFALRGLLSVTDEQSSRALNEGHFAGMSLHYETLSTRYPRQLGIVQSRIEEILEQRYLHLGGQLCRSWNLKGLDQDQHGVSVHGPESLRAQYLVACDGGHSTVRKLLDIPFIGTDATVFATTSDVILAPGSKELPKVWTTMGEMQRRGPNGTFGSVLPLDDSGLCRFSYYDGQRIKTEGTNEEIAEKLKLFFSDEYRLIRVRYASRWSNAARQAVQYRSGRIFLAGDAAHIHSPAGGQGLNLGVQDAFNLGWKLRAVLTGWHRDSFLDTYHDERHPVAARVLENTRAQMLLREPDTAHKSLRAFVEKLLAVPEANRIVAQMLSGLDIDYGGPNHTGKRLPDFRLGSGFASEYFMEGRGVLFSKERPYLDLATPWLDRVQPVFLHDLPFDDCDAMLVRPDGYVCWTGPELTLTAALSKWFGNPL